MKEQRHHQENTSVRGLSRRDFLKNTGKGIAVTTGISWGLLEGKAPVIAQERTLHILEWSSFVKPADVVRDKQAAEFGKQAGAKVTVEHINANDLPARATAAVEGGTGPDIITLLNNYPQLYASGIDNHNDLIEEIEKKANEEIYPFVKEAVLVNGEYKGVPYHFGGGANVYRKDIFQEVGVKVPETWDEYLEVGKKLKQFGMPVGQTLGHTFGDAPGFAYTLLWCFGGKEVDEKGKVAINSKETLQAVEFLKEFWFAACDEGGLAWDDTSNNRAFLAEAISCTLNGASIYFVARYNPEKAPSPDFADKLDHFLIPKGPHGRYHTAGPQSNCIMRYSKNKELARDYIRFIHEDKNYEEFLVTNHGYINGPLPKWQQHPMWEEDPAITIYRELPKYGRNYGYAGPYNRQSSEVLAKYIIVDLFAKVVKGDSPQSAIAWAEQELKNVYERG